MVGLDAVYATAAGGTLIFGVLALAAGIQPEVVNPIILAGAVVVGLFDIYWLVGGEGSSG